jgi:hypothetical protein
MEQQTRRSRLFLALLTPLSQDGTHIQGVPGYILGLETGYFDKYLSWCSGSQASAGKVGMS